MSDLTVGNEDAGNGEVLLDVEDEAYVQKMIDKAEGVEEKPRQFAGKFTSVEDLEKAYAELQSKLGQRAAPVEAPKAAPDAPKAEAAPPSLDDAKAAVQEAGLDFGALEREFRSAGDLSAESRAALAKKGIGSDIVDGFLAGQKAAETLGRQKVFEAVGGEQQYRSMLEWAQSALSAEEIAAYNEVAHGANLAALRMAAAGLFARYEAAEGSEPKLVTASGTRPTVDAYQSWAQVRADMAKPEYEKDEAFRRTVEQKLGRSSI